MKKLITTMLILSLLLAGCSTTSKNEKDLGPCKGILESHKPGIKYEWNLSGLSANVITAFFLETWVPPVVWLMLWAKCPVEGQITEPVKQAVPQQPAQVVPKGYEREEIDYSQYH